MACISCKNDTSFDKKMTNGSLEKKNEVFSEPLKREILKMIQIKNKSKGRTGDRDIHCSVVMSPKYFSGNDIDNIINKCNVIITFTAGIDINKISGYTFLENEMITCYILSDSCNCLVAKNHLIPFKDSIPGYPDILNPYDGGTYDAPIKIFEIVSKDSLRLIKSHFIKESDK
jgi:hypothetical protein